MIHTALPPFSFLSKENKMDDSDQIPAISTRTVTTSPRGQGEVGTPPPRTVTAGQARMRRLCVFSAHPYLTGGGVTRAL